MKVREECNCVILNSSIDEHYTVASSVCGNYVSCKSASSLSAVGAPQMVSLEPLTMRGAVRVTWSPPADLCGLTNPQYTIQYGRTTSTSATHSSTPSSSPLTITGLEVGQQYFVRVAVRTQSGSGTFSSWQSVTTYEGVRVTPLHVIS